MHSDFDAEMSTLLLAKAVRERVRYVMRNLQEGVSKSEEAQNFSAQAEKALREADAITDALIALLRVDHHILELQEVDLVDLAQQAMLTLGPATKQRQIQLSPDSDVHVFGDRKLLNIAVYEILNNALQYAGNGHPITITIAEGKIDQEVYVYIEDDGPGLSKNISRVDLLHLARGESLDGQRDVGVGLMLVHQIIRRHGGWLWLENGHKGGLRVCFTLPSSQHSE